MTAYWLTDLACQSANAMVAILSDQPCRTETIREFAEGLRGLAGPDGITDGPTARAVTGALYTAWPGPGGHDVGTPYKLQVAVDRVCRALDSIAHQADLGWPCDRHAIDPCWDFCLKFAELYPVNVKARK